MKIVGGMEVRICVDDESLLDAHVLMASSNEESVLLTVEEGLHAPFGMLGQNQALVLARVNPRGSRWQPEHQYRDILSGRLVRVLPALPKP